VKNRQRINASNVIRQCIQMVGAATRKSQLAIDSLSCGTVNKKQSEDLCDAVQPRVDVRQSTSYSYTSRRYYVRLRFKQVKIECAAVRGIKQISFRLIQVISLVRLLLLANCSVVKIDWSHHILNLTMPMYRLTTVPN
jgi:hypothetical protein